MDHEAEAKKQINRAETYASWATEHANDEPAAATAEAQAATASALAAVAHAILELSEQYRKAHIQ